MDTGSDASFISAVSYITASLGGTTYQGSGVIIGPHTVLTASHVLWDSTLQQAATDIHVYPGYAGGGTPILGASQIHYNEVNDDQHALTRAASSQDFAIIDFAADLTPYGPLDLQPDITGGTVHVTGYPAGNSGAQVDQVGTVTVNAYAAVLDYGTVTVQSGNSGGPVWIDAGTAAHPDPTVIGVVSTIAWATQLTAADLATIQAWQASDTFLWTPKVPGSTITMRVSEDAWAGHADAQFVIKVDGQQVGDVHTVTALHASGQSQDVTLTGDFANAHQVSVEFQNDQYGGPGQDVNLYVDSFTFNGITHPGSQATVDPFVGTQAGSSLELFRNGAASFDVPKGGLTLQVAEDAYQGDAQFQVFVDGHAVGGVQTVHASHASGQYEATTLQGDFSGAQQVAVQFLNDKFDGPGQDRNLYIDSVSVNGTTVAGHDAAVPSGSGQTTYSAELWKDATATFTVSPSHHDTLLA